MTDDARGGAFEREPVGLDERITADGSTRWPVEAGRYRLVVARACPWANRAVIVRRLLGLEDAISMGIAGPLHDALSERLASRRYLVGDTITEADVRLWVTLARFDAAYHGRGGGPGGVPSPSGSADRSSCALDRHEAVVSVGQSPITSLWRGS